MSKHDPRKVTGQRSPRWGFNLKTTIPCKDGTDYLIRRRLIQTPLFGVYVHGIHEDDGNRDPHNHPWSFLSIVLRGEYRERYYADPIGARLSYVTKTHRRFSIHRMGRKAAHRIVYAAPGLKTLILVGPRKESWGFFREKKDRSLVVGGTFVDWKDYEREIGTL